MTNDLMHTAPTRKPLASWQVYADTYQPKHPSTLANRRVLALQSQASRLGLPTVFTMTGGIRVWTHSECRMIDFRKWVELRVRYGR